MDVLRVGCRKKEIHNWIIFPCPQLIVENFIYKKISEETKITKLCGSLEYVCRFAWFYDTNEFIVETAKMWQIQIYENIVAMTKKSCNIL